jgi:hypothetical protein
MDTKSILDRLMNSGSLLLLGVLLRVQTLRMILPDENHTGKEMLTNSQACLKATLQATVM